MLTTPVVPVKEARVVRPTMLVAMEILDAL